MEGLGRREARQRLSAVGLGAGVPLRDSTEEDAGRVLEQSVPGGREVQEGSRVLLVGLPYPEAGRALRRAGFVLGGVEEAPSAAVPAGVILGQDPPAGSAAAPGSPVFLTTSTGKTGSASSSVSAPPSASSSASP